LTSDNFSAPLNLCAATARRIEEITARNRIRKEACLPLLSIPKELRRMKEAADTAEFEAFADANRGAVWDEVLATKRKARGEPNWHPSGWMEGTAFSVRSQQNSSTTIPKVWQRLKAVTASSSSSSPLP
jgi:hypothetical protein